jgi:hypothetical protein
VQNTRILCAPWGDEEQERLRHMCKPVNEDMQVLRRDGLDVGGMHYTFSFYSFGDLVFTRYLYGLGSVASTYCCIYCLCKLDQLPNSLYEDTWDIPLSSMRTHQSLVDQLVMRTSGGLDISTTDDKDYQNVKAMPSLLIDMKDAPPDPLHATLRMVSLCENKRQSMGDDLKIEDHPYKEEYYPMLRSIGVSRAITGLTGNECGRILAHV